MTQELELKFSLRPRCLKQIADLPWLKSFQASPLGRHKLYSIYFDTPDQLLRASRCSLRIRRDGSQWLQTIKSGGRITAGLHQHDEWEIPLNHAHPDLSNIPDPAIRRLFNSRDLRTMLQPVFVTRFTRKTQLLQPAEDCTIELCLDHGKIIAGERKETISEIELELKSGNPLRLLDFAKTLLEKAPCTLRLEHTNKAERGYRLYRNDSLPSPCKAGKINLKPGMTIDSALKMIMQQCLDQLTGNEKGFLSNHTDTEYLHQIRVALRRLRAAFQIFWSIFPDAELSLIRKELKWLTRQLNPARDWDILVTQILPQVNTSMPQLSLHPIEKRCQFYRKLHRQHAQASVDSPRYTRLLIELCSWLYQIDQPDAPFKSSDTPPIRRKSTKSIVTSLIATSHRNAIEHGKDIATLDAASLHALRIHVKELRYLIEFFQSLFPQNSGKRWIAALSRLQNVLGSINDCNVTQSLLDEIQTRDLSGKQRKAIETICEWVVKQIEIQKADLIAAWQDYAVIAPFWEKK